MEGSKDAKRYEEIRAMIPEGSADLVDELIKEIVFIESKLEELKKLPFIKINPENPTQQRNTPAAKMYKEFLQQYTNSIKLIEYVIYKDKRDEDENPDESPLRKWFAAHAN